MPKTSVERRYLALVFPWLPVDRLRTDRPHLFVGQGETPVAFTEAVGQAVRLIATNATAARLGLTAGLTLAEARARVPELEVFPADPHADMDWLERLADGCARYSATVALMPPDALVLDITDCVQAFAGERPLAADVELRMARRGILARQAFGDTPEIARALARFAGAPAPDEAGAVKRLPIAALELEADATMALTVAGLRTVGDVMARPPAGIAAHFGAEAATAVRRLAGYQEAKQRLRLRVAPVAVERRFAEPIARTDLALKVLEELAAEASATLAERHQGGRRWEARLFRADNHVQSLRVESGQPTRDVALLMRLFAERIDSLADPLTPGAGYDLLRLDVALAERLDATQLRLEGGAGTSVTGDGPVAQPVDQLSTRLRRRRVPRDSHLPAQAELMLPVTADAPASPWPETDAAEPPLRPIYLFDPPQPIESVIAEVPDGPPHRFRWRRRIHEVARSEGPERIAGEWWRRQDAAMPVRDYYRIEDRRGRRFWIFRHGLHDEQAPPRWYLHGLFA